MPPELQVRLLRVLETGEIRPLGAPKTEQVDVRVVAATDANLESMAKAGGFKAPLLHRLSGFTITVPPLRRRREDIGPLISAFLAEEHAGDAGLPGDIAARMVSYDWPGNVRELRNTIRQLAVWNRGRTHFELPDAIAARLRQSEPKEAPRAERRSGKPLDPEAFRAAFVEAGREIGAAARLTGLSERQV